MILKDETNYSIQKRRLKHMQMILILNNNIIMEQLFEQVHGGDHSAHLIEKLMLVPEHEVIIDTSPLTTVERN
jgi:hypothetical protein